MRTRCGRLSKKNDVRSEKLGIKNRTMKVRIFVNHPKMSVLITVKDTKGELNRQGYYH